MSTDIVIIFLTQIDNVIQRYLTDVFKVLPEYILDFV